MKSWSGIVSTIVLIIDVNGALKGAEWLGPIDFDAHQQRTQEDLCIYTCTGIWCTQSFLNLHQIHHLCTSQFEVKILELSWGGIMSIDVKRKNYNSAMIFCPWIRGWSLRKYEYKWR